MTIEKLVRSALVGAVLALALVSVMFAATGASVVPYWIQGLFAMGGIGCGVFTELARS